MRLRARRDDLQKRVARRGEGENRTVRGATTAQQFYHGESTGSVEIELPHGGKATLQELELVIERALHTSN